jgi:uncharacterized protein (DUF3820 family)
MENVVDFVMPWGIYKGKTLFQIALTEHGCKYLDWAVEGLRPGEVRDKIREAVTHPDIARRIDVAVGDT